MSGRGFTTLPAWAVWRPEPGLDELTIGIEEEVMLLDPADWSLAHRVEEVLAELDDSLAGHTAAETHAAALEVRTDPHLDVGEATAELHSLRCRLARRLGPLELRAGVAGTHPLAEWRDVEVSPGARPRAIYDSMRELARREPTFALHVQVMVDHPDAAIRLLDRLRPHLPLVLALSANSPFWQGRDSGLASARTPIFGAFPRVGIPRAFADYGDYVEAVDLLIRSDALPEPTFLWWDVRLQPRLGTVEVRIADAQTTVGATAALAALVQCLARLELERERELSPTAPTPPEVLSENRFLAARDGIEASLVDPRAECRVPARELLEELLEACEPHAHALGCGHQLGRVRALADSSGAGAQRASAVGGKPLAAAAAGLADAFCEPPPAASADHLPHRAAT